MEIRQLRYFLAVAEHRNFTRAAEQLHVAQPTLSQQIQEFENELGVRLFLRNRKGAALTDAGAALVEEALAVLARREQALRRMSAFQSGAAGSLTIGTLDFFETTVLPEITMLLHRENPEIRLLWRQYSLSELQERLQRGELDASVTILPQALNMPNTEKIVINHDRLALVYSKNTFPTPPSPNALLRRPLFLWGEWYPEHMAQLVRALSEGRPAPEPRPVENINSCVMSLLVEGGCSILPLHFTLSLNQPQLCSLPLPFDSAPLDIAVLYSPESFNPCLPCFLRAARAFEIEA